MATRQFRSRITANATTTIVTEPCAVREIVIAPNAVGSAWLVQIQDKDSPAFILVPQFTLSVPANGLPTIIKFDPPIGMKNGIDIVTSGTPAGALAVCITVDRGTKIPT